MYRKKDIGRNIKYKCTERKKDTKRNIKSKYK